MSLSWGMGSAIFIYPPPFGRRIYGKYLFMLPGFLFHQRLDLMLLAFRFQQCLDLLMRVDNIADRKIVVERGDKVGNVF